MKFCLLTATIISILFLMSPSIYAQGPAIPAQDLQLITTKIHTRFSMDLPFHWWTIADREWGSPILPPKRFGDMEEARIAGGPTLPLMLRNEAEESIAYIYANWDETGFYGIDADWRKPEWLITQAEVKRANPQWLQQAFAFYRSPDFPDGFRKTQADLHRQTVNNLVAIIRTSSDTRSPFAGYEGTSSQLWRRYDVLVRNGADTFDLTMQYDIAYVEQLEPLMQQIMNSLVAGPYPPNIIEARLNQANSLVTLSLHNIDDGDRNTYRGHPATINITLPSGWVMTDACPTVLAQDANTPVASASCDAAQSPALVLSAMASPGGSSIDIGKIDNNFYAECKDEQGKTVAEFKLLFTTSDFMYHTSDLSHIDASAQARQAYDQAIVKLEGCRRRQWQEHGALSGNTNFLHDSYIKTCGKAEYQVDTVKCADSASSVSFVATACFPLSQFSQMRPVIDGILNSLEIKLPQ